MTLSCFLIKNLLKLSKKMLKKDFIDCVSVIKLFLRSKISLLKKNHIHVLQCTDAHYKKYLT